jgi:hypothetical protein
VIPDATSVPGGTLTVAVAGLAMSKAATGGLNYATTCFALSTPVVDGDYIAVHFKVTGTHRGPSRESRRPVVA